MGYSCTLEQEQFAITELQDHGFPVDSGTSADQVEWEGLSTHEERSDFYASRGLVAEGY